MSESFMNDAFSTPLQCEGIQENEMKKKLIGIKSLF